MPENGKRKQKVRALLSWPSKKPVWLELCTTCRFLSCNRAGPPFFGSSLPASHFHLSSATKMTSPNIARCILLALLALLLIADAAVASSALHRSASSGPRSAPSLLRPNPDQDSHLPHLTSKRDSSSRCTHSSMPENDFEGLGSFGEVFEDPEVLCLYVFVLRLLQTRLSYITYHF